ncbi:MAG: hypothetical protein ACLVAA_06275 [Ruthenibacterium sp.]
MKRFIKKGLSIAIVLVLILACSVNVLAEGIEPRWKELSTFSCRLDKQSGLFTNANLSSHAASWHSANTINLTVTIQKWNGSSYVNTSYSWSNSGKGSASVDKSMSLSSGNYIAHAVVTVYDGNGSYVETVTKDSAEIII